MPFPVLCCLLAAPSTRAAGETAAASTAFNLKLHALLQLTSNDNIMRSNRTPGGNAADPLKTDDGFRLVKFRKESSVCLDGTQGGFLWRQGTQLNSVVVHMEGGGWCYDEADCLARSKTDIGSSKHWEPTGVPPMDGGANGLLSADPRQNPDFHNWTKFHLQYWCVLHALCIKPSLFK